jgi:hypothetical protein
MDERVNLAEKLALIDGHFRPKIVAAFNDHKVELVRVKGEFVWHSHSKSASRSTCRGRERRAMATSSGVRTRQSFLRPTVGRRSCGYR